MMHLGEHIYEAVARGISGNNRYNTSVELEDVKIGRKFRLRDRHENGDPILVLDEIGGFTIIPYIHKNLGRIVEISETSKDPHGEIKCVRAKETGHWWYPVCLL